MKHLPLFAVVTFAMLAITATAACGDDDDSDATGEATEVETEAAEGGEDEDQLSDEEYFAEVNQPGLDEAFESLVRVFPSEVPPAETAREGVEVLVAAARETQQRLSDLNPPEDFEEAHDAYAGAVDRAVGFLEGAAADTPEEASIEELETILFFHGFDPLVLVDAAECELNYIAEGKGIDREFVDCSDPRDDWALVDALEFEFVFNDGAITTQTTVLSMSNIGEQFHTLVIDSVEGDVTPEEISEIAANTIERLRGGQDPVEIGVLYADALPGEKGNLFFEEPLAPGRYVMLCYVIDEETGQPHYELGMVEEFTVE